MVIDIIFALSAVYGFYLGFNRGIIGTVFTVLSYAIGLMAAFKFAPAMTNFLETSFNNNNPLFFLLGFILSFVITMMFIRLLARGLEGLLKTVKINIINQVLGGILLSGIMVLVFSVLLWFAGQSNLVDDTTKQKSLTYPYLEQYPTVVWGVAEKLKPTFQEFWTHTVDFMDRMQDASIEREESDPTIYDIEDEDTESQ